MVDVPSAEIVPGVNALVVIGTLNTVKLAFTPLASTFVVAPVTRDGSFPYVPCVADTTFTLIWQEATPAFIDALVTAMAVVGATVTVNAGAANPAPAGQFVVTPGVPATVNPIGSVSVKLMPVTAGDPPPLVIRNVKTLLVAV